MKSSLIGNAQPTVEGFFQLPDLEFEFWKARSVLVLSTRLPYTINRHLLLSVRITSDPVAGIPMLLIAV